MHYTRSVSRGLEFIKRPVRWLPFFIADLIFLGVFLMLLFSFPNTVASALSAGSIASLGLWAFLGFLAWVVVTAWISAAVVHQSWKANEFRKSFSVASSIMLPVLCSVLLVQIIAGFLKLTAPPFGSMLAVLFGLLSAFIMQALVIERKGPISAIETSFSFVRKNFIPVVLFTILISAIAGIIFFAFGVWFIALFIMMAANAGVSGATDTGMMLAVSILRENINALTVAMIIMLLGHSIAIVFSLKAQTEFYMSLAKKNLVKNFFGK